jgi:hypothetical protein
MPSSEPRARRLGEKAAPSRHPSGLDTNLLLNNSVRVVGRVEVEDDR